MQLQPLYEYLSALCADVVDLQRRTVDELFNIYENTLRRLVDWYAPATTRPLQLVVISASGSTRTVGCRVSALVSWSDDIENRRPTLTVLHGFSRYKLCTQCTNRRNNCIGIRASPATPEIQEKPNHDFPNPRKMWRSVSSVLKRDKCTSVSRPSLTAEKLSLLFKQKIDAVRNTTANADPAVYPPSSIRPLTGFREYTSEEVRRVMLRSPPKTCMTDPLPTDVLLEMIDTVLPFITTMCNTSLREGILPASQKAAIITPILKKAGIDVDDMKSYRPISR